MPPPPPELQGLPNVTYCYITDCSNEAHLEASLVPPGDDTPSSSPSTSSSSTSNVGPRYTKALLRQTLQLLGCKPRHSEKASARVFLILQQRATLSPSEQYSLATTLRFPRPGFASVSLPRPEFERLVLEALAPHDPGAAFVDLPAACALQERRRCVTILLCGTSGTGKSTLASLLAARFGVATVVSTDSIRHMLRGFAASEDQPLLCTSTYQAGEAMLEAVGKGVEGLGEGVLGLGEGTENIKLENGEQKKEQLAVQGYLAQSEAVMAHVERLISSFESRRTSLIVEGVHLSPALAARLMKNHPSVVPFLVHISNEAKHLERFAVRAKAMTLRPEGNRYVRHLHSIRAIQDHLTTAADRHSVPKVDNTNVDRSVATIHATVLGCLRRQALGKSLLEASSARCRPVLEEYIACKSATWSGTDMLQLIRRKAAAGEIPSPTDAPSTSVASTIVAAGAIIAAQNVGLVYNETPTLLGTPPPTHLDGVVNHINKIGNNIGAQQQQRAATTPGSNGQLDGLNGLNGEHSIDEQEGEEHGEDYEDYDSEDDGNGVDVRVLHNIISDYGSVLEVDEGRSEAG